MVDTWIRLVESGEREFEDCPEKFKEKVRARLIEDGYME